MSFSEKRHTFASFLQRQKRVVAMRSVLESTKLFVLDGGRAGVLSARVASTPLLPTASVLSPNSTALSTAPAPLAVTGVISTVPGVAALTALGPTLFAPTATVSPTMAYATAAITTVTPMDKTSATSVGTVAMPVTAIPAVKMDDTAIAIMTSTASPGTLASVNLPAFATDASVPEKKAPAHTTSTLSAAVDTDAVSPVGTFFARD